MKLLLDTFDGNYPFNSAYLFMTNSSLLAILRLCFPGTRPSSTVVCGFFLFVFFSSFFFSLKANSSVLAVHMSVFLVYCDLYLYTNTAVYKSRKLCCCLWVNKFYGGIISNF